MSRLTRIDSIVGVAAITLGSIGSRDLIAQDAKAPPAKETDAFRETVAKLDPSKATKQELRGQELFFGKAKCAECHPAPYYTDNTMHNLQTERFYKPQEVLGHKMVGDGSIKTFPLRGIKDSPPYLHDGRLLTLDDTVEFFNLVLGTKLSAEEKTDLVAFMRCL